MHNTVSHFNFASRHNFDVFSTAQPLNILQIADQTQQFYAETHRLIPEVSTHA
jgi:hypothetical protein